MEWLIRINTLLNHHWVWLMQHIWLYNLWMWMEWRWVLYHHWLVHERVSLTILNNLLTWFNLGRTRRHHLHWSGDGLWRTIVLHWYVCYFWCLRLQMDLRMACLCQLVYGLQSLVYTLVNNHLGHGLQLRNLWILGVLLQ
jgi:hypothetical protein